MKDLNVSQLRFRKKQVRGTHWLSTTGTQPDSNGPAGGELRPSLLIVDRAALVRFTHA